MIIADQSQVIYVKDASIPAVDLLKF